MARVSPRVAWFRMGFGAESAWSGRRGQGTDAGKDLGEQPVPGWRAQGERAGVTDQSGGDTDQPVPQGGDHGLAIADAVPEQPAVGCGGAGELMQPAGEAGGEQRGP